MPRLPKATIDLTGVTIEQILNLDIDINKLSRNDLARVVGRLVSASNKRIRRLAKTEIGRLSPAYQSRMERGGQFSTKPIAKLPHKAQTNALRNLFGETKGFLELKTSSATKWKNVRTEITQKMGVPHDFLNTKTKEKKFWKTYREIIDGKNIPSKKHTTSRYNSERIQELIAKKYQQKGGFHQKRDDIVDDISKKIDKLYEQEQKSDVNTDTSPENVNVNEDDYDADIYN